MVSHLDNVVSTQDGEHHNPFLHKCIVVHCKAHLSVEQSIFQFIWHTLKTWSRGTLHTWEGLYLFFSEDCVPAQGYSIFISRYCTFQPSMELAPSWVKTIYYVEQTSDIIFGKLCECWC